MYVSRLTELHTACNTLSFSTESKAELCVLAHIDCYYCNSQYGLKHRVQSKPYLKTPKVHFFLSK